MADTRYVVALPKSAYNAYLRICPKISRTTWKSIKEVLGKGKNGQFNMILILLWGGRV